MLESKLTSFDYYFKKLSLFMRGSFGVDEMVQMYVDVLKNLDVRIDDIFAMYASTVTNDISTIQALSTTESDILDKVAATFGVSRRLSVDVDGTNTQLTLNNTQLQLLIKARIIQNNFDGTNESAERFYNMIASMTNDLIRIKLITDDAESARCIVYMQDNESLTATDRALFLGGLLTLKSMGIQYEFVIGDISSIAIFDSTSTRLGWDRGNWS